MYASCATWRLFLMTGTSCYVSGVAALAFLFVSNALDYVLYRIDCYHFPLYTRKQMSI